MLQREEEQKRLNTNQTTCTKEAYPASKSQEVYITNIELDEMRGDETRRDEAGRALTISIRFPHPLGMPFRPLGRLEHAPAAAPRGAQARHVLRGHRSGTGVSHAWTRC